MAVEEKKYSRLVIFDLDGTLIKGVKYSWSLLYGYVSIDAQSNADNMLRFLGREISYPEWCKLDCEELRQAGLTREKAYSAHEGACALTENFYPAIRELKDCGFAVAIISGGADPILYSLIPDADELFEGNIFINRLNFGKDGILESITPTEYDWDDGLLGVKGKRAGLELFCEKYGLTYDEATDSYPDCVFVGDDVNDFKAMEAAGLRILYSVGSHNDIGREADGKSSLVRNLPHGAKLAEANDLLLVTDLIKKHFKIF